MVGRQYDLSYENYFSDQGYFSVAIFYKDLENYVYDQHTDFDFSTLFPQGRLITRLATSPNHKTVKVVMFKVLKPLYLSTLVCLPMC